MPAPSQEELKRELDIMDSEHTPGNVEDTSGSIPDAMYQTRLDKIYFDTINEKLKLIANFTILNGTYEGRTIWKWMNLQTTSNMDYAALDMRKLGVPENFVWSALGDYFSGLLDNNYLVSLKTKNDFQNCYIQKKITINVDGEKKDDAPF